MAPTICEDDIEPYGYQNRNRVRRHCSVINYVGRQTNRSDITEHSSEVTSNEDKNHIRRVCESSERRNIIKRYRREARVAYDSDDSSNSIPCPMTFHNYAKRRRFSESEDSSENYISSSSESNDTSVSSTVSTNAENKEIVRVRPIDYLLPRKPITPYSPVSSTTGALTLYHRLSKAPPRCVNSFYRQDLMEIAMKTIILLQRNRSLHARLNQLKLETKAFVNSVMSNPENAKLRETLNQRSEQTIDHSPTKILAIKNH